MLVYFDEIPPLGRDFAWLITTLEADTDCTLDAPLEAHCHIDPAGQGSVHIEGRLRGVVTLGCDRCLVSYLLQLDTSFQVKAMVHSVDMESQRPGILESGLEDFETVACETPCIHLDELMRQQLLLALPEKRLCCSDCACRDRGAMHARRQASNRRIDQPVRESGHGSLIAQHAVSIGIHGDHPVAVQPNHAIQAGAQRPTKNPHYRVRVLHVCFAIGRDGRI